MIPVRIPKPVPYSSVTFTESLSVETILDTFLNAPRPIAEALVDMALRHIDLGFPPEDFARQPVRIGPAYWDYLGTERPRVLRVDFTTATARKVQL